MDKATLEIKNVQDYYVQPKLNGVFGRWDGKNLFTSGDNIINSVPHINKQLKGKKPTTGELYKHGVSLQKLCSLCLTGSAIDEEEIVEYFEFSKIPYIEVKTNEELKRFYNKCLKNKYEGIVLTHKVTGKQYKIKPEPDGEATLIGFTPAKGARNKATFGSLILQLDNGVVFKAGGIKDVDREMLWRTKPIGCRINFKYWELSDSGVPKMAKYQYIRTDKRGGL